MKKVCDDEGLTLVLSNLWSRPVLLFM